MRTNARTVTQARQTGSSPENASSTQARQRGWSSDRVIGVEQDVGVDDDHRWSGPSPLEQIANGEAEAG